MRRFDSTSPRDRRRNRRDRESGYVTAETAVVLPVMVFLVAAALWAVAVAAAQLRCIDAARDGARAAARGETDQAVMAAVRASAPSGASIDVSHVGGDVIVVVKARVAPTSGVFARVSAPTAAATAVAAAEGSS